MSFGERELPASERAPIDGHAAVSGWELDDPIAGNPRALFYRGFRSGAPAGGPRAIVKLLRNPEPGPAELLRLDAERQILALRIPGVVRPIVNADRPSPRAILLDDADGLSLRRVIEAAYPGKAAGAGPAPGDPDPAADASRPGLSIGEFLSIAIEMTAVVGRLHAAGITHKDIVPDNFLWDWHTGRLTLLDLGLASRLSRERPALTNPEIIEGSLAYVSPEQTGRMNRSLDYRTDLYSLGVTFYELLTGAVPFDSADPLELVHSHIARRPQRPDARRSAVPPAIAEIVLKLLEKNAENRYQSATGLTADLERCREQLARTGHIEAFVPAQDDASSILRLPGKLYGRDAEVEALVAAFERTGNGATEAMLVAGYSGVGKTALVHEIHKPITARRGYFLEGKFDPLHRNIPYSAWIAALTGLAHYVLTESETDLDHWRGRLSAAIGQNGRILTDVITDLGLVLGEQPPVHALPPTEMQNRFQRVFGDFVRAAAGPGHPITIFLDDLQWADQASLALIEKLLADPELTHVLIVGAYRDNEVDAGHPLRQTISRLEKAGRGPRTLRVRPLRIADVGHLIADTLRCTQDRALELARLIHAKTDGNPFFVAEFIDSLVEADFLRYDNGWTWDLDQIAGAPIGDDMANLMIGKIAGLPERTQNVLKTASCIGVEFDLDLVARVGGRSAAETAEDLDPALRARLVETSGRIGQFVHDKVSEAAYGLIGAEEAEELHHRIGDALLAEAGDAWPDDLVFRIAEQLNAAGSGLTDDERLAAFRANLQAGQRAKASAAFAAASRFYEKAAALISPDAWVSDYAVALSLYTDWAEVEYAAVNYPRAEELFELVLGKATALQDRIRIHVAQIEYYKASMRFADALIVVRTVLEDIGVPFLPIEEIDEAATAAQMTVFLERMEGSGTDRLVGLTPAASPYLEAIEVLSSAISLVWLGFPNASLYTALACVNLILDRGTCSAAAEAIGFLGSFLCALGNPKLGAAVGAATMGIVDRFGDPAHRALPALAYYDFVAFWNTPVRATAEPLWRACNEAAAIGDNLNAAYLINNALGTELWSGVPIPQVDAGFDRMAGAFFRLDQPNTKITFNCLRQLSQCLAGDAPDPAQLEGEYFSAGAEMADLRRLKFPASIGVLSFGELVLHVVMGDFERALQFVLAEGVEEGIASTTGLYMEVVTSSMAALTYLRGCDDALPADRARYLARGEATAERLRAAAEFYPANFLPLAALVAAEVARVKDDPWSAARLYNQSIAASRGQDFSHFKAIANDLAALFWLDQGRDAYARPHLLAAYAAYDRWGARAKTAQMIAQYPWLRQESSPGTGSGGTLDLRTVLKASQAISGEIELDRLLARLLQIVIENAGAQRGVLMLRDGDALVVEAEASSEERAAILQSEPLEGRTDLPRSIVNFVARTGESVLLDDASSGDYAADSAVAARRLRSVLCLPINRQGSLVGIIYLENNLTKGAFGPNHLEILEILCSQAAISLENARLYAQTDLALDALQQSEEKFRALVENTADVVFSMDSQGRFTYVSPAMERMSGFSPEEVVGNSFAGFIVPEDLMRATAAFEQALSGNAQPVEFRGATKDGRRLYLRVTSRSVVESGGVIGFTGILTDITERRQLEEQLLQAMKMESIGRLAGGVAHDFNNLLTAILGNAELALMELPQDSPTRETIGEISNAGERASTLTRQLLAFASRQIIAPVRLNLSTVVFDSERMLRRLLGEDIAITTVLDPNLAAIEADPGQMEQLLVNLTINARDAMPKGGRLAIETRNAMVGPAAPGSTDDVAPGSYAVLTISDTGEGMTPETMARIFEPFFTTKGSGKGTGLGLATCHGIVKQNHGHIFVFSEPGVGSTFRIMLPVARGGAAASAGNTTRPVSIEGTETILVVEDEEMVRRLAVLGLRAHGYGVIEAPDGAEALRTIAETDRGIDLVISDVVMPGISGPELGAQLAKHHPEVRLILVSGHAESLVVPDQLANGRFTFLQKPFTPEQLARKVREVLDRPLY